MNVGDKEKEKIVCVRCSHIAEEKDQYCTNCGAPLINRCTDEKTNGKHWCGHVNKSNAAYCAKCGCETTFKKHGLV